MTRAVLIGAFALVVGMFAIEPAAVAQSKSAAKPIASGFGKGAYPYGDVLPAILATKLAQYPDLAIAAGVEGEVLLEAIVGPEGSVTDVHVVKSLDSTYGLDASAMDAVRAWKFAPGKINGKTVSVLVKARVAFHLHAPGSTTGPPVTESLLAPDKEMEAPPVEAPWPPRYTESTPGFIWPTVTREVKPLYTRPAMDAKIQGAVEIDVAIDVNGKVTAARITKSLDKTYGLDDQALQAAKKWTFTPCRLNGDAIPCTMGLVLEFRLH